MLKITKEDIQSLNDADLRNLIGMLCEATLYTIQNRTTDVMYGGNQDEKDDGIDVYVKASKIADGECPILRNNTIFQVKKPKMPMNKIKAEMTDKNGNIKKCISDLEKSKGAYIIVSSGDDLTQKTYTSRKDTMQTIIDEARLKNVVVDFYDCGRIATWVGDYPSIVCWVLNHVGKNVNGWTSYCNWSSRNTTEKEYLIDENSVIYKDNFSKDNKLNLVDGINEIRKKLLWERTSVRLAGLSGVGKTRFAQALFDEKIGINPLNKEEVIYGDIGDSLQPEPIAFIQQLQTLNKRIILVVDNCEPNMHNKLTEICQREKSLISLLTIEYDVKEDDNIDSNNYYLSPTSDELLKKMLKRDFENISDINISTIANCSDGNFRIAIYLARSIANEKNIGVLKSNEIFERIFYQGGCIDSDLLAVGEVCSLFYSFNTMPELGNVSNELNIISSLIDVKPLKVFEKVEELAQRQIIQRRGDRMCAVLPHALANKLSMDFLKKYPSETILDVINKNQRLTISFFRRLKFLHLSKEAQDIGKKFIDEISNNEIYSASRGLIEKIRCVSIINPGLILEKIENIEDNKFFSRENKNLSEWIMILCTIAYDRKLFKRAINIMIKFILPEKENESYNSNKDILKAFFHIYGSGTYATIDDKIEIIDDLLMESDVKKNEVGLILLEELMATGTFICFPITDCGSQIRGYGLEPNPTEWYNKVISYCDGLLKNEKLYNKIKNILISHFKDLASVGFYYELEKVVLDNLSKGRWSKLWISLLVIKHFDSEKIPEEMMKRIDNLINIVRPKTIKEKIETFLCNSNKIYYELDDTTDDYDSVDTIIYELGCEIGRQSKHMKEYIGMLNNNSNIYRIGKLAEGIYCKCQEKEKLILDTLDLYDASNCNVIRTIVNTYVDSYHTEDYEKCSQLINRIAEDENYKKYYTFIQLSYQIDEIDVIRLKKQIINKNINKADIRRLEFYVKRIKEKSLIELIKMFLKYDYDNNFILDVIFRYIESNEPSKRLKKLTRNIISSVDYAKLKRLNSIDTYVIEKLVEKTFVDADDVNEASLIFENVNNKLKNTWLSFYDLEGIMGPLIQKYPFKFLEIFIDYKGEPSWNKEHFLKKSFSEKSIFSYIDDDIIIEWIKKSEKQLEISYVLYPFIYDTDKQCFHWSKLGKYILNSYFENDSIVNNLINNMYPSSWSNEYSNVLKDRVNLFCELKNSQNPVIRDLGEKQYKEIMKKIDYFLSEERKENEKRFNSFEENIVNL